MKDLYDKTDEESKMGDLSVADAHSPVYPLLGKLGLYQFQA